MNMITHERQRRIASCYLLLLITTVPLISLGSAQRRARRSTATSSAQNANSTQPSGETIGTGTVFRTAVREGGDSPPWKKVEVANVFGFKRRPTTGQEVTVVPLGVDLAPITLRILGSKRGYSEGSQPAWWEVDLEPVTERSYFDYTPSAERNAGVPFEVAVLHPAVPQARAVPTSSLRRGDMPSGVPLAVVTGAVDLDADGAADVLLTSYCCDRPTKPAADCDYQCSSTYRKMNGAWKVVDTSKPL